jgi:hypothetical protein
VTERGAEAVRAQQHVDAAGDGGRHGGVAGVVGRHPHEVLGAAPPEDGARQGPRDGRHEDRPPGALSGGRAAALARELGEDGLVERGLVQRRSHPGVGVVQALHGHHAGTDALVPQAFENVVPHSCVRHSASSMSRDRRSRRLLKESPVRAGRAAGCPALDLGVEYAS